jgi:1,4-dihydroxy-2-naphthoyl-CoA hydrolase
MKSMAEFTGAIDSPLAQWMGFEMRETTAEHTVVRLALRPEHLNPTGAIHAGTMLALADNTATKMAITAQKGSANEGKFMVTVDLHATMLRNQSGGVIEAEAKVVRAGARVTVIRTQVKGEGGKALIEVTTTHIPA